MSQSNAAAIKRRVNVPSTPNSINPGPAKNASQAPTQSGFTLPQAIALIDTRLITLEKFMREGTTVANGNVAQPNQPVNGTQYVSVSDFSNIIDEFNNRFTIFADEISEMKDIVLKLQSYTMEVNKTLMDERIQVFSDLNANSEPASNLNDVESAQQTSLDLKDLIQTELSASN
jgi:hypothetical protein